jgi:hypothetical protein
MRWQRLQRQEVVVVEMNEINKEVHQMMLRYEELNASHQLLRM